MSPTTTHLNLSTYTDYGAKSNPRSFFQKDIKFNFYSNINYNFYLILSLAQLSPSLFFFYYWYKKNFLWQVQEQAGAELCQAQVKLGVIVYIGVKFEAEILVEVWIQLLA